MGDITCSDHNAVRILTLDNEPKRNAFSGEMTTRLYDELHAADADPTVRCIIVTGAGEQSFSSGHDLQEVLADPATAGDPEANSAFTTPPLLGTPVVGAVNGGAYAAGFILALNCDLRVAGENAMFCAVGAQIGLVPVGGQLSRILATLTYPVAFQMLSTGKPMDAETALRVGFVTEVCPPAETMNRAIALAEQIASSSPSVVRAVKTGLRTTIAHGFDAGAHAEALLARVVRDLPDGDEGVSSFLEKRPAAFPDAPTDLQARLDEVMA